MSDPTMVDILDNGLECPQVDYADWMDVRSLRRGGLRLPNLAYSAPGPRSSILSLYSLGLG